MRLIHPLAGSRFGLTMRSLRMHGGIAPTAIPSVAVMIASHGLRFLSCELEIRRADKLAAAAGAMPDPVFIVGHWRSGTTLLANLMSFDEGFFFPTLIEAISPHDFFPSPLEKLSRKLLPLLFPDTRPVDRARVPLRQPFPQEDEMALAALGVPSLFNAFYFPSAAPLAVRREVFFEDLSEAEISEWCRTHKGFVRKLALLHPGKRPLLKNPAHAARIPLLRRMYPRARFILLTRDKAAVVQSTNRLFERLWPLLALQRFDLEAIPSLVEENYLKMESRIGHDWPDVLAKFGLEVEFDRLVANPVETVHAVYDWMEQPVSAAHDMAIQSYMLENMVSGG